MNRDVCKPRGPAPTPTATPFIPTPPAPQAGWIAKPYSYASAHPHAATAAGDDTYAYDANGNMTCRKEGGVTFNQIFNAENRLAEVQDLGTGAECPEPNTEGSPAFGTWEFTYDGDGNLAKRSYSDTQLYVNLYFSAGMYEERYLDGTLTATLKYYSIAGMTIAMDDGTGLKYLLTDHLGSVVAVTNGGGALLSEQRYLPFGEVRTDEFAPGSITQTDLAYTGQRDLPALGLMDYKARFYDPGLGRFIQPDTIIPKPANPQSWNRYVYVLNDPIARIDPTGQASCTGSNWDDGPQCKKKAEFQTKAKAELKRTLKDRFGWKLQGDWTISQLSTLYRAGVAISNAGGGWLPGSHGSLPFFNDPEALADASRALDLANLILDTFGEGVALGGFAVAGPAGYEIVNAATLPTSNTTGILASVISTGLIWRADSLRGASSRIFGITVPLGRNTINSMWTLAVGFVPDSTVDFAAALIQVYINDKPGSPGFPVP